MSVRLEGLTSFASISFAQYLQTAERIMKEGLYFKKRHYDHFRPMTTYCVQGDKLLVDEILLLADIDNELKKE